MIMELSAKTIILTTLGIHFCGGIKWAKIRCSEDDQPTQEGVLPKNHIGRYPWLGVIQYDFRNTLYTIVIVVFAERMRHAITTAVRIHPWYAIGAAEDIVKIDRQSITNTTHFVVWRSTETKYYMGVTDYVLHHEFTLNITHATVALIMLMPDQSSRVGYKGPALPICLPYRGTGSFDKLYVVRMSDAKGDMRKEVVKMQYIDNEDCNSFYKKAELDYPLKVPTHQLCATAAAHAPACVWDAGALLVSRESDFYWTLLGFGTRGPGCGAPARFVAIHSLMQWINVHIAASSYYQCEQCIQQCCRAPYGLTDKEANKKMPFI